MDKKKDCAEFIMGFCSHEKFYLENITKPCIKLHSNNSCVSEAERKQVIAKWQGIVNENNHRQVYLRDIIKNFYLDKYCTRTNQSIDYVFNAIDSEAPPHSQKDILRLKKLLKISAILIDRMPDGSILKTSKNLIEICPVCAALHKKIDSCTHNLHDTYLELRNRLQNETEKKI